MKPKPLVLLFFLLPSLALLTVVKVYPSLFTIFTSLHEWDGLTKKTFVGIDNYLRLLNWKYFQIALKNNVIWMLVLVPAVLTVGISLAVLLKNRVLGKSIIKTFVFVGMTMPLVVAGIMWMFIYDPKAGILNALLRWIGAGSLARGWLGDPNTALAALIVVSVWIWSGFSSAAFVAGLESIPQEMQEQAIVDGCNSWQAFWRVTFPLLMPVTVVVIVMTTIWGLKMFDIVYVTTEGGPGYATEVMAHQMYYEAFRHGRFGQGSAIAVILTLLALLISSLVVRKSTL